MGDLTISELFTPVPSGVSVDPTVPIPDGTWLAGEIATAQILGLETTAWQPGGPERTIFAINAVSLAGEDAIISLQAQGRFLDFDASGTVTTTLLNGQTATVPVTPDPSIPSQNPTGAPGWLDALGQNQYDVTRLAATYATGPLAIVNTSGTTKTYSAQQYHTGNATTGATYSNPSALSVPPSAIAGTGGTIIGISVGVSPTITTNTAHGLAIGDVVYFLNVVGVTGINGKFAYVTAVPGPTTIIAGPLSTGGVWTSGGTIYKCTVQNMAADIVGPTSNASVGQVTNTITQNVGVLTSNLVSWSAANWESNAKYAARCRLKLAAVSPNGPSQAYEYFALTAAAILGAQVPPVVLTNGPIAKAIAFSNPQTEVTYIYVASSSPASSVLAQAVTQGCAQLLVTAATNATPIQITSASAHGLSTGNSVIIDGVLGNTAANGGFTVTVTGANTFTLDGSVGSGTYTGGGSIDGGDLGQVDNVIQDRVVPDNDIAITQSALAFPVSLLATVVVPQAYLATFQAAGAAAFQALLESFPIGGNVPPGGSAGIVPWSAVEGALFDAGVIVPGATSYVRQVTGLLINGSGSDLAYPAPNYVAIEGSVTLNVVGV